MVRVYSEVEPFEGWKPEVKSAWNSPTQSL